MMVQRASGTVGFPTRRRQFARMLANVASGSGLAYAAKKAYDYYNPPPKRRRVSLGTGYSINSRTGNIKRSKKNRVKTRVTGYRKIKKDISRLKKLSRNFATRLYRELDSFQFTCLNNQCSHTNIQIWDDNMKTKITDNVPYLNRTAAPSTSEVSLDISKANVTVNNIQLRDIVLSLHLRNNNEVDCEVKVYWIKTIGDGSTLPLTFMSLVAQDYGISDAATNPMSYISNYPNFRQRFKIMKTDSFMLHSGDVAKSFFKRKYDKFDPAYEQTSNTFHHGDIFCMVRVMGTICHDSASTSSVGYQAAGVDGIVKVSAKLVYPSDVPFQSIEYNNSLDAVGTGESTGPATEDQKDEI